MSDAHEDSILPDSDWWKAFRKSLLEAGDLVGEVGGIDPAGLGDRVRGVVVEWLDAGPGRAIEDRLTAIEARLDALEAEPADDAGDDATSG